MVQQTASPIFRYVAERTCFQSGGHAKIYRAKHMDTNEIVAIKVIPFYNSRAAEMYTNETKILERMRYSKHTVQMREHFVYQNQGYIVMELKQLDLFTRCATFSSVNEVKNIFAQVCTGIKELHQKQISHLDIKLENILLDAKDNVSICDFGSSLHWFNNDYCDKLLGSDFYLAPEVIHYESGYSSTKADIWSLGILLSVLITGKYPYEGDSDDEVMVNYFTSNVSLDELDIFLPGDSLCHDLLTKMLSKSVTDRPTLDQIINHPWIVGIQNEQEICFC